MYRRAIAACAVFAASFAGACQGEESVEDVSEDEELVGYASSAIVDGSALYPVGALGRPTPTFSPATKLTNASLKANVLGGEQLALADVIGSHTEVLLSPHFRVERRIADGELQVGRREEQAVPIANDPNLDPATLRQSAMARLVALGVPPSEMGEGVEQHRILAIDSERRDARRVMGHATLVGRAFHGIRVIGSRAVVVHDRAGGFAKLLLDWPAVAPEGAGHQWRTSMSVPAIVARAQSVLSDKGLSGQGTSLEYAYREVAADAQGRAVFALKCVALVDPLPEGSAAGPDRPREIVIDLDP